MRACLALVLLAGCSLAAVQPVMISSRGDVDCNTVPPILDTVGASMLLFADIGTTVGSPLDEESAEQLKVVRAVSVPFIVGYTLSAIYGWRHHVGCARVRDLSDHDKALWLTRQAVAYARGGSCHNALVLGHRIEASFGDDEYAEFLAQPAIKYCRR